MVAATDPHFCQEDMAQARKPSELEVVQSIISADVAGWGRLEAGDVSVENGAALTEWHTVLFLEAPLSDTGLALASARRKVVATVPSWRGATLLNKEAASRYLADRGLAPAVLAELRLPAPADTNGDEPLPLHVVEFLSGGILSQADLAEEAGMAALGALYGELHVGPTEWFTTEVAPALVAEGLLPVGPEATSWAGLLWVMPWLQQQVPAENKARLAAQGVDWAFVEREIVALPTLDLLPTTATVTVHGDIHEANLVWTSEDKSDRKLKMIDFDMTAIGPAGSDLGFLALALFRCAFSLDPNLVVPRELQRHFAKAYLQAQGTIEPDEPTCDDLLLLAHLWSYTAMIKIGLICGVLMARPGHEAKREIMRTRGPVLLNPNFLSACKVAMKEAKDSDGPVRQSVLQRGLFFHVTEGAAGSW